MSMIISTNRNISAIALPAPRTQIRIRQGTMEDIPFIDSLQKVHNKQLGWMPTAQLEGKIRLGHVVVAEEGIEDEREGIEDRRQEIGQRSSEPERSGSLSSVSCLPSPSPLGYCIGNDQYFKRDDVGIIYQLCVAPGTRRSLVGAALVKAMFEKAAWGCRLFCCWCAQDIEANHFWESLGFVPLAFRAGSRTKGKGGKARVHVFWQKRIRPGDETTPYWFPAQTGGGAIREDRIVLPIPTHTHWSQAKPIVLPGQSEASEPPRRRALPRSAGAGAPRPDKPAEASRKRAPAAPVKLSGFCFAEPKPPEAPAPAEKKPRAPRQRLKNDPAFIAFARELRDRWIDQVSADPALLLPAGKYDVAVEPTSSRRIEATIIEPPALPAPESRMLPAA